ncbi:basic secretory protein-like protein [Thermophagus sp. OGC60D27]|uniref:basic secretory protein-like protein n=1 Tax=Thermophagus sp. OGC60D27 TaxID=3458415 RepID=UPI0040384B68
MKHQLPLAFCTLFLAACTYSGNFITNTPDELVDHNIETCFNGSKGINRLFFHRQNQSPVKCYSIFSSGSSPQHDPYAWELKGSKDGKHWETIDKRDHQTFCARYQEKLFVIQRPARYSHYLLEASTNNNDSLKIAEILLFDHNKLDKWSHFSYPQVDFQITDQQTEGAKIYQSLVQMPEEFIQYHAQKVAEILYFSDNDDINKVNKIRYTLKNYNGISAKSGQSPEISIVFSTRHVETAARESLFQLNNETRGVLFHELTHAYQYEPKGIGTYSTNKEFWACIEGLADAVRTEAGFFDIDQLRKPGGNWLDGYRTTGFFLHWLTTKDPDAIRKFHRSVCDLQVWSFDKAMQHIFGPQAGIQPLWDEYQQFLQTKNN